ncbi:MAG: hypothetical protein WBK55_09105, partial [Alphaproteobacteria bacterium]
MTLKSIRNRKSERGNVFFTLFGAVAIVGVLGAGIMATMRGPLSTMVNVNRRAQVDAEMSVASKLVLMEAAQAADDGDCDADGFVEPLPYKSGSPAPTGGGQLPDAVASNKLDPWGTPYGYCAWDAGSDVDLDDCNGDNRLAGTGDGDDTYTVIALISAGPNQAFESTCTGGASPDLTKTAGSDDVWSTFSYAMAVAGSGGLWKLNAIDPDLAEINKDISAQGATFAGAVDLTDPLAKLTLGAGSMVLPDQTQAPDSACDDPGDSANHGILRVNTGTTPDTVEICDAGTTTWKSVAEGATSVSFWKNDGPGAPTEIYYSGGNVGIGGNNPAQPLDVTGNVHISDNFMLDAASAIVWDGAASDPSITESASGLNVIANGGFGLTGNATITGTGADGTTNALLISNSTPTPIFVVENDGDVGIGVADPNDKLDISGSIDITEHYKLDGVNILTDNATTGSTIIGKSTGTGVLGNYNTILGGGAGATLTTGINNILIGAHDTVPINVAAAATSNFLNIGNTLYGDLANDRIGIGVPAPDDALDVSGNIDASGNIEGTNITATGDMFADNLTTSVRVTTDELYVNNTDDFVPGTCNAGSFNRWDGNSWECETDSAGSGGGTQDLASVLGEGNDAAALNAEDFLKLGSNEFCNEDLTICFDPEDVASGAAGSALSAITAAIADNSINSAAWNQIWNWQLTGAETGFKFGETAASTGGAANQYILSAETLATSTAIPFFINNVGAGRSFQVNDASGDTSPFVIAADGKVGIGTASPTTALTVRGDHVVGQGLIYVNANAGQPAYVRLNADANMDSGFGLYVAGTAAWHMTRPENTTNLVFVDSTADRVTFLQGGEVGIGDTTPDDGTGGGGQNLLVDIEGPAGATYYCDQAGLNCFTAASVAGSGLWERNGTVVRIRAPGVYATDDLVFGAAQLAGVVGVDDDNRLFFDKSKGAFRAGSATGTQWDDANVGTGSVALGTDLTASGAYSAAIGLASSATGAGSSAFGYSNTASGIASIAVGQNVMVGDGTPGSGAGDGSIGIGLMDDSVTITVPPAVTGVESFGIFMGDQDAVDITASNIMALMGGRLVIDPDTTSATNTNVSTGVQQLELDVQGDIGAVNFCDEAGNNCFTPASVASNRALSAITAAAAGNSINNADHAQVWNWLLTTADKDAFTFTENTASTATGHSSILKAATLATSTATPLRVTNLGAGDSLVVNDETGDADASPFLIGPDGRVAIGTTTLGQKLAVAGRIETQGGMLFNQGSDATDNLMYLGSTVAGEVDGSLGFFAGGMGSSSANDGAYFLARGNDFSDIGNQRGNMYFTVGNPAAAGALEGSLNFFTGAEVQRMIINNLGEVGIGDTTPDDGTGGGGQNLLLDIEGPAGASHYCDQNGLNCFTPASVASNRALSAITAAAADNSINNGNWNQIWNWQLAAGEVGHTFGENVASAGGSADQYILAAKTLATSTATPFMITNLGAANSFRVNDETGDADTTPFVIEADGDVGIGTATPADRLNIAGELDDTGLLVESFIDSSSSGNVTFRHARGTEGSETIVQNNDEVGHLLFQAHDGTNYENAASIVAVVDGATGNNDMPGRLDFYTALDGTAGHLPRMTIKNDGDVGIGTTAPAGQLHISSDAETYLYLQSAATNQWLNPTIIGRRSRGTVAAPTVVVADDELLTLGVSAYDSNSYESAGWIGFYVDGTPGNNDMPSRMSFFTTPDGSITSTERMTIKNTGKVGIGITNPDELLDLGANAEDGLALQVATSADPNNNPYIVQRRSRGTMAAPTAVQSGDNLMDFYASGHDGTAFRVGAMVSAFVDGTPGANDMPTRLEFNVQADGAGGWLGDGTTTPEMVIKNTGAVGIGMASPASLFVVASPTAEVVGAAATITANSCGTVKQISATANRTTDTTNTFTAPTASYNGCCMDVVNIDTVDTITLDNNANFITGPGADLAVGPGKAVRVCSDGTSWYQASTVTSAAATLLAIDDLTDAFTDYAVENNLIMGRAGAVALAAGAQRNVFIGQNAGATTVDSTVDTDSNTAVGYAALNALTSGSQNTAVGRNALADTTDGVWNVAVGNQALENNTSGNGNVAVGTTALYSNVAKRESTAIGHAAMFYADDTAVGAVTYNTAVGAYALEGSTTPANNTGTGNTAVGHEAMQANSSGTGNVAMGYAALHNNDDGDANIALGYQAMNNNVTGNANVAIGEGALLSNNSRQYNTAVGHRAMMYADDTGAGDWSANTAVGALALQGSSTAADNTGQGNTAIGYSALTAMTSGEHNTALGLAAGDSLTEGSDNILIGYDIDAPAATTDNHLNIGGTIFGDLGNDRVRIGGSGVVGAGPLIAAPPTTEVVAAAAVITANACGTIKQVSATANRTTDTTDTFTTPTASYAGCCMDVVNIDTVDTITLDQNANFFTGPGTDLSLGPGKAVRVCSDGTSWYQAASITSVASGGNIPLSGLTAALADNSINNGNWNQVWNWQLAAGEVGFTFGENTASAGGTADQYILAAKTLATSTATPFMITNLGAADSFRVNDETGDADTTPFVIQTDGDVGIGTASPVAQMHISSDTETALYIQSATSAAATWNPEIQSRRSRGTVAAPSVVQSGDSVLSLWATAYDSNSWETPALIQFFVDGTPGNGDMPGRIEFQTQADGAAVNPELTTPEMVIKSTGFVGIGTATPATTLQLNTATGSFPKFRLTGADVTLPDYSGSSSVNDVSATNTFGQFKNRIDGGGTQTGGMMIQGFTGSGVNTHFPLHLIGTHGGTAPTTAAVTIGGQKWSGTNNRAALTSTTPVLDIENNYATAGSGGLLMRVMGDGKVGIGTTTPTQKLHIADNGAVYALVEGAENTNYYHNPGVVGQRSRGTLTVPTIVQNGDELMEIVSNGYDGNSWENSSYIIQGVDGTPGDDDMPGKIEFYTRADNDAGGPTERMRITSGGNVGIGTATPVLKMHIVNTTGDNGMAIQYSGADSDSPNLELKKSRGTPTAPTIIGALDEMGEIRFMGYDGATWRRSAQISGNSGGTPGAGDMPGSLLFYTTADGAADITERMRINSSGDVGIGTTSPASRFIVASPTAEVIAAAAVITANSCGTVKQISATANRTTNTTDTFTSPTASYNGCCMDVVNIDAVDTITLDQNANFITGPGTDLALAPGKAVRVCSDGTSWYQAGGVSSATSASNALSAITAAAADNSINNGAWNQTWNWQLTGAETAFKFGENVASSGGASNQYILSAETLATSTAIPLFVNNVGAGRSFQVDDASGDTSPFVIDASGAVGIGTTTPHASSKLDVRGPLFLDSNTDGNLGDIYSGPVWPYSINVGWDGQDSSLRFNAVGTAGGTADFRNLYVYDGKTNPIAFFEGSTKRLATGGNDITPDAMLEVIKDAASPLFMLSAAAAGNGDLMIVDASGRVGIGITPDELLDVGSDAENGMSLQVSNASASSNPYMDIKRSRGTMAAPTAVQSGDALFDFSIRGHDGTAHRVGAMISAVVDGTTGATDM